MKPFFRGLPQELLIGRIGELRDWADRLDPEGDPNRAAQRVLQATFHLEPQIEELHDALQFDECQWMRLDYSSMDMAPVPQISNITETSKKLAVLLFTRAEAFLNDGDPNSAARDIVRVIKFGEIARFESGSLVGALVRASMSQVVLQTELHRLLMHSNWSDASLLKLQEAMAPIDLLEHFDHAMHAELAGGVSFGMAAMNGEAWTQGQWSLGRVDWGPEASCGQWFRAVFRGLRNRCYAYLPDVMPRGWHG
ncbi:MAG: hypothetical protein GWQ05_10775 [Verrucomicrobiaceae bacterium]|nr:hypothetical protein [Verrucomicrobiaceae bacterium]